MIISSILLSATSAEQPELKQRNKQTISLLLRKQALRTSYTEYEVDALALNADEGRGDRRNV